MKKPALVPTTILLTVMLIGCAPVLTPVLPTFTPILSPAPTITFTLLVTETPTFAPTLALFPSSTAAPGFKRVSVNYFMPNLSSEIPISFEIPQDYVWDKFPQAGDTFFWMPQKYIGVFRPEDTSHFEAKLALSTYDSQTDRFSNLPNDFNDEDIIGLYEFEGAKINRIERKNIGEFPILILELELSYEAEPGVVMTHAINRVFIATLVDGKVLWIDYYFSLPTNFEKESAIWERFESSFERNP